ncbi:hypothetical protein A2V82_09305 [candidate division KSB1 bacterium RBG_16_48_16]|nr:MAG: hypothetical protein A2V82_09305 [candidate division KSB1 bacterium RBG_16_48_16]
MKSSCKIVLLIMAVVGSAWSQPKEYFTIARIKYGGGGDWYNDPSILPNLLQFLRDNTTVEVRTEEEQVSPGDDQLYSCPLLFLTGHGRIFFSQSEAERLRSYLTNGGFLYADDDYGMDEHFRREMKKVFPDKEMVELPFSHPIYHVLYDFPNGLPKIHEHDGGPPKGFGYFHDGRLVVFYSFNTNISDGWADADVHGDPPNVREAALKMGANIVLHALIY